jgi:hypothetical protein
MHTWHGRRSVIGEARAAGPAQEGVVARYRAHREGIVCLAQMMSRCVLISSYKSLWNVASS